MFIYEILNTQNNKRYVGQTTSTLDKRWKEHCRLLNQNQHHCIPLQRAWIKYGSDSFKFLKVCECKTLEELNNFEFELINFDKISNKSYNVKDGGNNGKHSLETKKHLSRIKTGRMLGKQSKETCLKKAKSRRPNGYPNVISPTGKIHSIQNLNGFCKRFKLNRLPFRSMLLGKCRQYKKWRLTTTPLQMIDIPTQSAIDRRPQGYPKVLSPDNVTYEFINLREFCRLHKLNRKLFMDLISGKKKLYKNWTITENING